MFNLNRKVNEMVFFSKNSVYLVIFIFFFISAASIFFSYVLNQNIELKKSNLRNEWYEKQIRIKQDKKFENEEFEKLIETVIQTLETMGEDLKTSKVNSNSSKLNKISCKKGESTSSFSSSWQISGKSQNIDYESMCDIGNFSISEPSDLQIKFAAIIKKIVFNIKGLKNINDSSFESYSKLLMDYFTNDILKQKDYDKKFPFLSFEWIYISTDNSMLYYPASENTTSLEKHIKERPWWIVAHSSTQESGITPLYIDADENLNNANLVRTIWYKFQDDAKTKTYYLCVDLFFNTSSNLEGLDLLNQYVRSTSIIKDHHFLSFITQNLIISLLIFFGYFKLSKKNTSNLNTITNFILKQDSKIYASKNADNVIITINGETRETNKSESSTEAGWSLSFPNAPSSIRQTINRSNIGQNEASSIYKSEKEYDLSMANSQPLYRCVETWKVSSESRGYAENLGFLVATWSTTNSIKLEDELDIKSIYWEKEYENILIPIKNQLRDYLSISEDKKFIGNLDTPKISVNVPQYLVDINFIKKIIDSSSYLNQRKVILPENQIIAEIYRLGTVNAVCTRNFLQILVKEKRMKEFFRVPVAERYSSRHLS